jgi:hypothetical protein
MHENVLAMKRHVMFEYKLWLQVVVFIVVLAVARESYR